MKKYSIIFTQRKTAMATKRTRRDVSAEGRRLANEARELAEAIAASHGTIPPMSRAALVLAAEELYPHITDMEAATVYTNARERRAYLREYNRNVDRERAEYVRNRLVEAVATVGATPGAAVAAQQQPDDMDDGPGMEPDQMHGPTTAFGPQLPHPITAEAHAIAEAEKKRIRDEAANEMEFRNTELRGCMLVDINPSVVLTRDELIQGFTEPPEGDPCYKYVKHRLSEALLESKADLALTREQRETIQAIINDHTNEKERHDLVEKYLQKACGARVKVQAMRFAHRRLVKDNEEFMDTSVAADREAQAARVIEAVVKTMVHELPFSNALTLFYRMRDALREIVPPHIPLATVMTLAGDVLTLPPNWSMAGLADVLDIPLEALLNHRDRVQPIINILNARGDTRQRKAADALADGVIPPSLQMLQREHEEFLEGFKLVSRGGPLFEYGGYYLPGASRMTSPDFGTLARAVRELFLSPFHLDMFMRERSTDQHQVTLPEFADLVAHQLTSLRMLFDLRRMTAMVRAMVRAEGGGPESPGVKLCPEISIRVSPVQGAKGAVYEAYLVGDTQEFRGDGHGDVEQIRTMIANLILMVFERNYDKSGVYIHSIASIRFAGARLSAAGRYMETPPTLKKRKCTRNIFSDDDRCGQYAVALSIYLRDHSVPNGADLYSCPVYQPIINSLKWTNMSFPTAPHEWTKFERMNPDYGVFVYDWDEEEGKATVNRVPSNRATAKTYIYLVLINKYNDDTKELEWHYLTVTMLDKLFSPKKEDDLPGGLYCPICMNKLTAEHYQYHISQCSEICETQMVYPEPGTILKFDRWCNEHFSPVCIVADTECMLKVVEDSEEQVEALKDGGVGQSGRVITQQHIPTAYGLRVVCMYPNTPLAEEVEKMCPFQMFVGEDPTALTEQFFNCIENYTAILKKLTKPCKLNRHPNYNLEMVRTRLTMETTCCICHQDLDEPAAGAKPSQEQDIADEDGEETPLRVPYVNHYSGVYEGEAHFSCNKLIHGDLARPKVTVWFHNGSGYDMKILLSNLGGTKYACQLDDSYVLAKSSERITRFDLCGAQFKDSMSHLPSSLEVLVERITKTEADVEKNCVMLREEVMKKYGHIGHMGSTWKMLARKGVFPYSWFNRYDKQNCAGLPAKEAFRSDLGAGGDISDAEYAFAMEVYEKFECHSFGEYLQLYLLTDVCLLGDVWRQYRSFMKTHYNIDPNRFESLPATAFAIALKTSAAQLELISEPDMALFFQRSIRGGVSYAVRPHIRANNVQTRKLALDLDTAEHPDDEWILYFDANMLYGGCMTEYLPECGYEWLPESQCTVPNAEALLNTVRDKLDAATNYMFEVDLSYPVGLHSFFNDLPPAPATCEVTQDFLSSQQQHAFSVAHDTTDPITTCAKKLLPSLLPKERYVTYGTTLALYVELGVKIDKVHRIATFHQSPFMRAFIELNVRLRKEAQLRGDDMGVNQTKLTGNSAYGKCIQDVLREVQLSFLSMQAEPTPSQQVKISRQIMQNTWKRAVSIGNDLWIVEKTKRQVDMSKPIQVGAVILEISKYIMYKFWYKALKPWFGDRVELAYMDTDSFIMKIRSGNAYKELAEMERASMGGRSPSIAGEGIFDWSSMSQAVDSECPEFGSDVNRLVQYKFKNELGSKHVITQGIFVRSKLYQLEMYDRATGKLIQKNVAKGVPKSCRGTLQYTLCLESKGAQDCIAGMIRSCKLRVTTGVYKKKALPDSILTNDKRFIYERGLDEDGKSLYQSLAIGHYISYIFADSD